MQNNKCENIDKNTDEKKELATYFCCSAIDSKLRKSRKVLFKDGALYETKLAPASPLTPPLVELTAPTHRFRNSSFQNS